MGGFIGSNAMNRNQYRPNGVGSNPLHWAVCHKSYSILNQSKSAYPLLSIRLGFE